MFFWCSVTLLTCWDNLVWIQIPPHSVLPSVSLTVSDFPSIFLHSFTLFLLSLLCLLPTHLLSSEMCVAPALSLWMGGWLHSFLAMSQARPMAKAVLIVVSRSRWHRVLPSKQTVKRFVTKLSFSLSDVGSDPSRIPLDPSREHGDGLGRSPESSPSLLLLWVLLHMNGKKRS